MSRSAKKRIERDGIPRGAFENRHVPHNKGKKIHWTVWNKGLKGWMEVNPFLGKEHSEETKKKIRLKALGRVPWNKGKKGWLIPNPNQGKHLPEETKQKIREKRLNRIIPSKDTKIEVMLQTALKERSIKFETHLSILGICQADIVFPEKKITVFADGDYWHNLPNVKEKDEKQVRILKANGWKILRFWEHEILENCNLCVNKIMESISNG